FLPSTGVIRHWREPAGEGIRVDAGFRAGDAVTPYYDALLAKLVVHAGDRPAALARMGQALSEFEITGVTSNLAFLKALISHPQVASGEIDTGFIERELSTLTVARPITSADMAAAFPRFLRREQEERIASAGSFPSPWDGADGWIASGRRSRRLGFRRGAQRLYPVLWYGREGLTLEFAGSQGPLRFTQSKETRFEVALGEATETVSATWSGRDLD